MERFGWLATFVILPLIIGRMMGAPWREIALAFAVVLAFCAFMGLGVNERTWEMRFVWAGISYMIIVLPGIPLILFVFRLLGRWSPAA